MKSEIREIISSVRDPYRYIGGEVGSAAKPWGAASVRVCLAFPDTYEIGMSNLGHHLIYYIVNSREEFLADRVYAPWADMEAALKEREMPLFALESGRPLVEFDIIGFTLAYELSYTNILSILSLSGIPIYSKDRSSKNPLVIAGGPCTYNPMPVSPFFDAMVIGDGEEVIFKICETVKDAKEKNIPREDVLRSLSNIEGVFVPALKNASKQARTKDLNDVTHFKRPLVPHVATQQRLAVEAVRGCARGCRFCQAGYIYRPVRQRDGCVAEKLACDGLLNSGAEELSFLSLSIGDWPPLEGVLKNVHANMQDVTVDISLPSLRSESLSNEVVKLLGNARSGSFTLAPEAGTEKMRSFMNKGNTDEDLFASVQKVFESGWHAVKLYFMIGLPNETSDEIDAIVRIANKCLDIGKKYFKRPDVTVSTSTFVPKAHTPLQWERQISVDETLAIQSELKKRLRRPGLYYRWHKPELSRLEGVFSRGGAELSLVVAKAFEKGARFDAWDECFKKDIWREVFLDANISADEYLKARDIEKELPWEFLGAGPTKDFLLRERTRAYEHLATSDCTKSACTMCGMCETPSFKYSLSPCGRGSGRGGSEFPVTLPLTPSPQGREDNVGSFKFRLRYKKESRAAFLGSIETLDALRRAARAALLPLCYSEGYHPRPKIGMGPALSVGIESECEFVDIELKEKCGAVDIIQKLNLHLPQGIQIVEVIEIFADTPSIDDAVKSINYEVTLFPLPLRERVRERGALFDSASSFPFTRIRGEKRLDVDLKDYVTELAVDEKGVLAITIRNLKPAVRLSEILTAIFNLNEKDINELLIKKIRICPTNS